MDSEDLLSGLDDFIGSFAANYSCGGAITVPDIVPFNPNESTEDKLCVLPPVTLRWERKDTTGGVLRFPPAQPAAVEMLVDDCHPAVFGYNGQNVLDPSYRQALAMDSEKFDTSFCPYASGIIDRIRHVLLPDVAHLDDTDGAIVVAQLYKLNVYKGPSDHFKAHVDTPREDDQFGSLVVCLPSAHAGGRLHVRHSGDEVVYDWSQLPDAQPTVQWAAFYSDCEHEIDPVTDGHRLTLTYNLYCRHWKGNETRDLGEGATAVRIQSTPLYQKIHQTLAEPGFMTKGGVLGIYCSHAYPTRSQYISSWYQNSTFYKTAGPQSPKPVPVTLKGRDMVLFAVFKRLGLDIKIRPIIQDLQDSDGMAVEDAWMGLMPGTIVTSEAGGGEDCDETDILRDFGQRLVGVKWLQDKSKSEDAAMVHLRYGNQAEVEVRYGSFALMVGIPPHDRRLDGRRDVA